jgi:hypothetical protein
MFNYYFEYVDLVFIGVITLNKKVKWQLIIIVIYSIFPLTSHLVFDHRYLHHCYLFIQNRQTYILIVLSNTQDKDILLKRLVNGAI